MRDLGMGCISGFGHVCPLLSVWESSYRETL